MKVTELKELLTNRSLPVSGKKEELIARLQANDSAQPTDDLGDLAPPEEEYDWDTDTNTPTARESAPAPAPEAAAPKPAAKPVSKPVAKPVATTITPTVTVDKDAALALELEKRKKRAERFGIPVSETVKAVERAQRFGIANPVIEDSKKAARGKKFGNQVWKERDAKETKNGDALRVKSAVKKTLDPAKKVLDDPVEAEKAKKRAERFGGGNEAKKVKT